MWAAVQGMDTLTVSELGKVVNLTVDSSQLTVGLKVRQNVLDNSRNGYLLIYPSSEYSYEIRSGQKGDLKLRCIGVRKSVCVLNLNEEKSAISSIKGYQIEMMINCVNDCKGELGVTVADHVSTSELGSINIIMDDIDELHLEVLSNTNFDANKLRFHVGGYSKNSSIRAMTLQAFGNMNKDGWPSATSNDFHLMHIHGNEISKVIYSKDKYFCSPNSNCKYRFTMNTKDMWRVVFYAQQTGTIENIKEYESYVGQANIV